MDTNINSRNRAQILVLFAVSLVALIALTALVLDGGMLFLNRRAAQAAADAGALAGARVMCKGGTASDALIVAEQYATDQNAATLATASFNAAGDLVVDVTINQRSFFAQIFSINNLDVPASAATNCFPPGAVKNVIPVAWTCRKPLGGLPSDSSDCTIQSLDWATEMVPLIDAHFSGSGGSLVIHGETINLPIDFRDPGDKNKNDDTEYKHNFTGQVYVIMDSENLVTDMADDCSSEEGDGKIICDLDGDGVPNIGANGDRSWLLLEEGKGANDLKGWLENGLTDPLRIHTWLAGASGVTTSVYKAAQDYVMASAADPYKFAILPVFNDYCVSNPYDEALCSSKIHAGDLIVENDPNNYNHIIGFAAFYVTCVDDSGKYECPAAKAVGLPTSAKSIEGYFVRGVPVETTGGTGGVDLGIYIISLTH